MRSGFAIIDNEAMAGLDHIRTIGRSDATDGLLSLPMGLSRLEAWGLTSIRHHGSAGVTLRVTASMTVASFVIGVALVSVAAGPDAEALIPRILVGALIATMVVAPVIAVLTALASRLEQRGQLLVEAATTDPLTGIYNRRGFFDGFDPTSVCAGPLAVAMVDVDDFEQLNDRFGHRVGDDILRHTAHWLDAHAEARGTVARLGGDEFVLVAPVEIVSRLQTYETFNAASVMYSATIGSALIGDDGFRAALAEADAELYRHKVARHRRSGW